MRRREFIGGIGAAMLPLAARAKAPTIGILYSGSLDSFQTDLAAMRQGVAEGGAARGMNAVFEIRAADGDFGRLAALAEDLVGRGVAVIVTAPHRRPAFEAVLEGINRLKKLVPIWKKEHFVDGEVWVEGDWDSDVPVAG